MEALPTAWAPAGRQEPAAEASLDRDEYLETILQLQAGDPTARLRLRLYLQEHPQVWRHIGDLGAIAESLLIELVTGNAPLRSEAVRLQLADLKQQFLAGRTDVLAQLAVERIAACWLHVQYCQMKAVTVDASSAGRSWEARLNQAQRRYLAAQQALARMRTADRDAVPERNGTGSHESEPRPTAN